MSDQRFTVEEANALLPKIRHHLSVVFARKADLRRLGNELATHGVDVRTAWKAQASDAREILELKETFKQTLTAIQKELDEIQATGAVVKDLQLGLVDFNSRLEGREVLLCWQFGEGDIAYYHELDAGFAGRRPVHPHSTDSTPFH
ncbi:MAG: DUF2203 domain-containing protein [Myxococcales bacterium]|nr:DUF2203 domain-containing protein [Myxococcales bacterium]